MTPRSLDWRSVEPKLRKIDELLTLLAEVGEVDADDLRHDLRTALMVERVLTVVVDLALAANTHIVVALTHRAPTDYGDSFRKLAGSGVIDSALAEALVPSAGLRNVLVHGYLEVDQARVAAAIPLAVEGYRSYLRQVAAWFVARGDAR